MKIGVYVGSFNPVHKAHQDVVSHLISNGYLDKVIVVPTGNYWDKQDIISLSDRVNMLNIVFNNNVEVNEKLGLYQYTYQIMNELKCIYPNDSLYLIIGADNVNNFYKWKNVNDVLNNYVLVIPRDGIDVNLYIDKYNLKDRFIIVKDFNMKDISSTFIRDSIKLENLDLIKDIIDDKVIKYIVINDLYKS